LAVSSTSAPFFSKKCISNNQQVFLYQQVFLCTASKQSFTFFFRHGLFSLIDINTTGCQSAAISQIGIQDMEMKSIDCAKMNSLLSLGSRKYVTQSKQVDTEIKELCYFHIT
jgi:hypothetical protein